MISASQAQIFRCGKRCGHLKHQIFCQREEWGYKSPRLISSACAPSAATNSHAETSQPHRSRDPWPCRVRSRLGQDEQRIFRQAPSAGFQRVLGRPPRCRIEPDAVDTLKAGVRHQPRGIVLDPGGQFLPEPGLHGREHYPMFMYPGAHPDWPCEPVGSVGKHRASAACDGTHGAVRWATGWDVSAGNGVAPASHAANPCGQLSSSNLTASLRAISRSRLKGSARSCPCRPDRAHIVGVSGTTPMG